MGQSTSQQFIFELSFTAENHPSSNTQRRINGSSHQGADIELRERNVPHGE